MSYSHPKMTAKALKRIETKNAREVAMVRQKIRQQERNEVLFIALMVLVLLALFIWWNYAPL